MEKINWLDNMRINTLAVFAVTFLLSCLLVGASSYPDDSGPIPTPPTYQRDIQPLLTAHCLSCHGPRKSAKRQLDTYESASAKIDDILYRVQLPSNNRKFMPYKMRQPPLSKAKIQLLQRWKEGGLLEK